MRIVSLSLRCYISSEGMSLQRARNFLEQQSGSLSERQAVLLAARSSCFQGSVREGVNQELLKNLQQVGAASKTLFGAYG